MRQCLVFLFVCLFSSSYYAQIRFQREFPGLPVVYELRARSTPDGGWVTGSNTVSGFQVIRYDKCGVQLWAKNYSSFPFGADLIVSKFGGFAITGYHGPSTYEADLFLLRLRDDGSVNFCKVYSASTHEHTYSLGEDASGNFLINGNTTTGGVDFGNNLIIKTDSTGNIIWSKLFGTGGYWALSRVMSDGSIIRDGGWGDLYKVDASGNEVWSRTGFWPGRYEPLEVPGGYVTVVRDPMAISLLMLDMSGNMVWQSPQVFVESLTGTHRLARRNDGHIFLVSGSYIIEFSSTGKYIRQTRNMIGGSGAKATDVEILTDNSILIAGVSPAPFNTRLDDIRGICPESSDTIMIYPPNIITLNPSPHPWGNKTFNVSSYSITVTNLTVPENTTCAIAAPSLNVTLSGDDTICEGIPLVMQATISDPSFFDVSWHSGTCSGPQVSTTNPWTSTEPESGTYFLRVEGCDTSACLPFTVAVNDSPNAAFNYVVSPSCEGILLHLQDQSSGAGTMQFFLNGNQLSGSSMLLPTEEQSYELMQVVANTACSDTMRLNFAITADQLISSVMPNVFTPNGDGENDLFSPRAPAALDCIHMQIFDRWGKKVFETKKGAEGWNGSGVSDGTYFYTITIGSISERGMVSVLR
jgi:gliding motility-associated-like protein